MLVISRGISEEILIGPDIIITVVSFRGKTVRLGITAPEQVTVHRGKGKEKPKPGDTYA